MSNKKNKVTSIDSKPVVDAIVNATQGVLPVLTSDEKLAIREKQLAEKQLQDEGRALTAKFQKEGQQLQAKFEAHEQEFQIVLKGIFEGHSVDPNLFNIDKETLAFQFRPETHLATAFPTAGTPVDQTAGGIAGVAPQGE